MNEENLQKPLSLAIPAQTGLRLQDCKRERRRRRVARAPRMARVIHLFQQFESRLSQG
jgi:hypothetical protein